MIPIVDQNWPTFSIFIPFSFSTTPTKTTVSTWFSWCIFIKTPRKVRAWTPPRGGWRISFPVKYRQPVPRGVCYSMFIYKNKKLYFKLYTTKISIRLATLRKINIRVRETEIIPECEEIVEWWFAEALLAALAFDDFSHSGLNASSVFSIMNRDHHLGTTTVPRSSSKLISLYNNLINPEYYFLYKSNNPRTKRAKIITRRSPKQGSNRPRGARKCNSSNSYSPARNPI